MTNGHVRVEREIAGVRLVLETGQVARQAGGSVIATLGDSKTFAAVTAGGAREELDFFPLFSCASCVTCEARTPNATRRSSRG